MSDSEDSLNERINNNEKNILSGFINPLEYIICDEHVIRYTSKQFCDKYYVFDTKRSNYSNVLQITFIKYINSHSNGYCWDDTIDTYFEEEEHFIKIPNTFYNKHGNLDRKLFYDKYLCNTTETCSLFAEIQSTICNCGRSQEIYSVKNIILIWIWKNNCK